MNLGPIVETAFVWLIWLGLLGLVVHLYRTRALHNLGQSATIALEALRLHKLRAFLTMLGVIIGVMSVTLIVMISNGFTYFLTSEFKKLGSDTILVFFDRGRSNDRISNIEGLVPEDIDFLLAQVPELDIAAPIMQLPEQDVIVEDRKINNPRIFASDDNFDELNRIPIVEGRSIDENDVLQRRNVVVVGTEIRDRLFTDKKAIGKFIQLKGITLEVIGVFDRLDMMGQTNARDLLIPLTTAQDKWIGGNTIMMITTRPKPGFKVSDTVEKVHQAMMRRSGNKQVYRVDSRESILGVMGSILGVAGTVLAGIAGLSLLVGGIGIMNIMLVSVTERTREIGLRKAVGATAKVVLTQFLVEASVLSLIGGIIGMSFAYLLGILITLVTKQVKIPSDAGLAMPFPVSAALGAMAFSALIGVFFGLYPAISAAKLNPIDALRKE